jgi:integrase
VLARSLADEHFEAYKRAKLDGVDVRGGEASVRKLAASTVNKRLDLARRVIDDAIRRGSMTAPNPVREVVRPRAPKREQMVLTESEMRKLIEAAGTLELRALIRCFCELRLSEIS